MLLLVNNLHEKRIVESQYGRNFDTARAICDLYSCYMKNALKCTRCLSIKRVLFFHVCCYFTYSNICHILLSPSFVSTLLLLNICSICSWINKWTNGVKTIPLNQVCSGHPHRGWWSMISSLVRKIVVKERKKKSPYSNPVKKCSTL